MKTIIILLVFILFKIIYFSSDVIAQNSYYLVALILYLPCLTLFKTLITVLILMRLLLN